MSVLIYFVAEPDSPRPYTTVAFVIGALASIISGYIGMVIATYTNCRTTKECATSINHGFIVAFRGGQVLGFVLVGVALLVLMILIVVYESMYIGEAEKTTEAYTKLYEMIAGYGLGGSTVALFGRVGGGIYTKAADVGSDLAGKVIQGLEEDDPSNPGVIADNVGDNVGDIAGMGSDLFGSLAEATCAALIVAGTSPELIATPGAIYFPLLISSTGILVSFITTFFASHFSTVTYDTVESVLKWQLIISTIFMTGALYPLISILPETFTFEGELTAGLVVTPW
jgi:Na+/H+-translocating membrane pyrophosphatase